MPGVRFSSVSSETFRARPSADIDRDRRDGTRRRDRPAREETGEQVIVAAVANTQLVSLRVRFSATAVPPDGEDGDKKGGNGGHGGNDGG